MIYYEYFYINKSNNFNILLIITINMKNQTLVTFVVIPIIVTRPIVKLGAM
jgi:hypothetical protein